MDHKQIINQRQFSWLVSSVVTSGGILTLQNVLIRISETDAWVSYLLSILYIFIVAGFFAYLSSLYPQMHIFEISMLLLGRWGGTLVNLLIVFHIWLIVLGDLASVARFTGTLLLHNTPLEILIMLPCLLLIYFGRTSVEVIARVNDIFYPLFVVTVLLMPLLLSNEFSLQLISPVLTTSYQHVSSSNFLAIGGTGDVFFLGAFLHTICNTNQIRSSIRHGGLLGIFLMTLILFLILIVLGPKMPGNFLYPTYNLVQMIHVTDFLDRLDLIMLTIWLPTFACKMVALYLALLIGISSIIREHDYPTINKPVALFLALTTILSFKSTTELNTFANFSTPVIVIFYQPMVIAVMIAAAMMRHRKHPPAVPQSSDVASMRASPSQKAAKMSVRFSYKQWVWIGNILMLFSAVCIGIGLAMGKYMPVIGTACGICFGCCLFLTAMTTYMEVSLLKQSQAGK
ncbi:endospore germination permease [Paenibacillus sp. GCM10027628]|uniref:GerAB/ArcD/ProY family transporter n=1 Tax=Paenibacillus sp. GCM10027628 TaxID=3273413 RepID=UPI0036340FA1